MQLPSVIPFVVAFMSITLLSFPVCFSLHFMALSALSPKFSFSFSIRFSIFDLTSLNNANVPLAANYELSILSSCSQLYRKKQTPSKKSNESIYLSNYRNCLLSNIQMHSRILLHIVTF